MLNASRLSVPAALALALLVSAVQLGVARATGELPPRAVDSGWRIPLDAAQSRMPASEITEAELRLALARIQPDELAPGSPAAPFVSSDVPENRARALECLTQAVYYEARSESVDGQKAVAQVVLNRVRHPAFPNSVCGVVFQGSERRTGCQFSFTCDGSMNAAIDRRSWATAQLVAAAALNGAVFAPVGMATHYHANYVTPWWAAKLSKAVTIGTHIFYRWKGEWGDPLSFDQSYAGVEQDGLGSAAALADPDAPAPHSIEAGVSVYRGSFAAADAAEESGGVRIHRGGATGDAGSGVTVHSGTEPQG